MKRLAFSVCAAVFLAACTTTNETDPSRVSWGDLLWGRDRLDAHLADERARLGAREATRDDLAEQLAGHRVSLSALDARLEAMEISVGKARVAEAGVVDDLAVARSDLNGLENDVQRLTAEAGEIPSAELVEETLRVEREIHVLRTTISQLAHVTAVQFLETGR